MKKYDGVIRCGQIWVDDKGIWDGGYEGEMAYIVKSSEKEDNWDLICFQEWSMGGYIREGFKGVEIRKMRYVGHIHDLRKGKIGYLWMILFGTDPRRNHELTGKEWDRHHKKWLKKQSKEKK